MDDDPREILGVGFDAGEDAVRAAYLRKVKEFPPESAPKEFERVRDAYELLRDPRRRAAWLFFSVDPQAPLASLADGCAAERQFAGPQAWLAVIREKGR